MLPLLNKKMKYNAYPYLKVIPNNIEYSEVKLRPFYHSDLKDSLENIVIGEAPVKKEGLLGKVFTDKTKTLKATIKALFNEVILREKMNVHLLNKIDEDVSKQNTEFSNLKTSSFNYSPDLQKELNNKKMQLQDNVLELDKERRKEYLECWRDLMFLKKYLFSALKDYWDLSNRRSALAYNPENEKGQGY